jgi:hypothetical protein
MFTAKMSDTDSSFEAVESDSDLEVKYRTKFGVIIIMC